MLHHWGCKEEGGGCNRGCATCPRSPRPPSRAPGCMRCAAEAAGAQPAAGLQEGGGQEEQARARSSGQQSRHALRSSADESAQAGCADGACSGQTDRRVEGLEWRKLTLVQMRMQPLKCRRPAAPPLRPCGNRRRQQETPPAAAACRRGRLGPRHPARAARTALADPHPDDPTQARTSSGPAAASGAPLGHASPAAAQGCGPGGARARRPGWAGPWARAAAAAARRLPPRGAGVGPLRRRRRRRRRRAWQHCAQPIHTLPPLFPRTRLPAAARPTWRRPSAASPGSRAWWPAAAPSCR
jgi:hypothetical protein